MNKNHNLGSQTLLYFFTNASLPSIVETQQGLHFGQSMKDTDIVVFLSLYLYNRPTFLPIARAAFGPQEHYLGTRE